MKECCEVGGAGIEWNINTIQVRHLQLPWVLVWAGEQIFSTRLGLLYPSVLLSCRPVYVKEIVETTQTVLVVKCAMKKSSGMTRWV